MKTIEPSKRRHRHKRLHTRAWVMAYNWNIGIIAEPTEIERKIRRARILGCIAAALVGTAITFLLIGLFNEGFRYRVFDTTNCVIWNPFKSLNY